MRSGSFGSSNPLIQDKKKFTSRHDLEQYYLLHNGTSKLTSFLVPDLEAIKKTLNEKKIQHERRVRDEFDHMINWNRVFESIWMQIRWL